jgi:hypothetical protein
VYFQDVDNRASVNPATKHKAPGICTWLKRRPGSRCLLQEAGISASKR